MEISKLKYYQLQTMLRALKCPRHLLHEPVGKMRDYLTAYANESPEHGLRVRHVYEAVVTGALKAKPHPVESHGIDVDETAQRVYDQLKAALTDDVKESCRKLDEYARSALTELGDELRKQMTQYRPVEIKGVVKPKKLKGRQHAAFERVCQLASQRVNVLMVGPAGCGKTHLAGQVSDALGLDFSSISCSAGMSESQLAGWLLPVGAGGKFEHVSSPFIEMYEKGGAFLFDEIDSGDPNTMTFMNKAIANAGFYVPQRMKKPYVEKHKDFACMAAANTFGNGADSMYVGRNQLDAATMDRFRAGTVLLDYDIGLEQELVHPKVLEWGLQIRSAIVKHKLRRIMSTRIMLDLSKMAEAYKWSREQWELSYMSDWSEDEKRRVVA